MAKPKKTLGDLNVQDELEKRLKAGQPATVAREAKAMEKTAEKSVVGLKPPEETEQRQLARHD